MELLMGVGVYQIYYIHQELNIVSIGGIVVIVGLMAVWPFIARNLIGNKVMINDSTVALDAIVNSLELAKKHNLEVEVVYSAVNYIGRLGKEPTEIDICHAFSCAVCDWDL